MQEFGFDFGFPTRPEAPDARHFAFPIDPREGDIAVNGGVLYIFDGHKWVASGAARPVSSEPGQAVVTDRPPGAPPRGMIWLSSHDGLLWVWDGHKWVQVTGVPEAPRDDPDSQERVLYGRNGNDARWEPALSLAGGRMRGVLLLNGPPEHDSPINQAVTKGYVDRRVTGALQFIGTLDGSTGHASYTESSGLDPGPLVHPSEAWDSYLIVSHTGRIPAGQLENQVVRQADWVISDGRHWTIIHVGGGEGWAVRGAAHVGEHSPGNPATGDLWYDTEKKKFWVWRDHEWTQATGLGEAPDDGQSYLRQGSNHSWNPGLLLTGGEISGSLTVDQSFRVKQVTNLEQDLNVPTGNTTLRTLTVSENATVAQNLTVNAQAAVQTLSVNLDATIGRDVTINRNLNILNDFTTNHNLTVMGTATLGVAVVNGDTTARGNLTVIGLTRVDDVIINDNLTINGNLVANALATLHQLTVTSTTTLQDLTIVGSVTGLRASNVVVTPTIGGAADVQSVLQALNTRLTALGG